MLGFKIRQTAGSGHRLLLLPLPCFYSIKSVAMVTKQKRSDPKYQLFIPTGNLEIHCWTLCWMLNIRQKGPPSSHQAYCLRKVLPNDCLQLYIKRLFPCRKCCRKGGVYHKARPLDKKHTELTHIYTLFRRRIFHRSVKVRFFLNDFCHS